LRARTAFRVRVVTGVTIVSALLGAGFASRYAITGATILAGVAFGALNGFVIACLETLLQGPAASTLRRLSMPAVLLLRTAIYGAIFVGVTTIVALLLPGLATATLGNLLLFVAASLAFNFVFLLRGLLGGRTLIALLTGRYHQPRSEERIVLFLDLHGSTELAERLGDEAFHRFLNRVFFDLTEPVLAAGGEIYRYVGDEIIVTWSLVKGARDAAAIACPFAIESALARHRAEYRRSFGAEPRLRCALHAGPLIVGEMGDIKREIVMLGDTMNTAARIEEACRMSGRDVIASSSLLHAIRSLPPDVRAEPLGTMRLRGKQEGIDLFALSRPSDDVAETPSHS
jgi:adenylate cyclase